MALRRLLLVVILSGLASACVGPKVVDSKLAVKLSASAITCADTKATDVSAEPNYTADYLDRWQTVDGCDVRLDYVMTRHGACFSGVDEILIGRPLGTKQNSDQVRIFVRDPTGIANARYAIGFEATATVPPRAQDTGLRQDGDSLWIMPGDDRFVWLVGSGTVERWPLEQPAFGCG